MPRRKTKEAKKTPYKMTVTFTVSINDRAAFMERVKSWRAAGKDVKIIDGMFSLTAKYDETGILEDTEKPEISHVGYTPEQCGRDK